MIIEVSNHLLDLIAEIEQLEREKYPTADFMWLYNSDGTGAVGTAGVYFTYKEFDISVGSTGKRYVYTRELGKYDYDNTETHPLSDDYGQED